VAKKGYDDLIAALAALPESLHWRLDHIGGGVLSEALAQQARDLRVDGRIVWHGAQPQRAVLQAVRAADIFVLASRIAADGDRDGLPNVLMEAQSQGLACIATEVSAIPELINHGDTGLLVPPQDRNALARALAELATDPARRRLLGQAGQDRVRDGFSHDYWIKRLAGRFGLPETEGHAAADKAGDRAVGGA
jgi:glycosyltransferase involved in cell wall biosynthesis